MLKEMLNSEITIKRGVLISLITALLLSMSMTGYLLIMWDYGENVIMMKPDNEMVVIPEKEEEIEKEEEKDKIKVYVVGEVKNPSVVTLEKGQIIEDAVLLAGGFTENADVENINLAYILTENVMLQIRGKKDVKDEDGEGAGDDEGVPESGGVSENTFREISDPLFPGMNIVADSGGVVVGESLNSVKLKININTASKEQLTTLPGIGPAIADNIVAFRKENGRFEKIEDIMKVSGIGDAKFKRLKDLITVE
ncbi:MAG TPA: competence protein ComEA [Ruminiclostridium sp.]|uniref:ComE operon protein 1 n=1 Tax=Acetivibrio saccincola TaxID=1677857 RepID=A0A2K9E476_9FIRM|nr:helix-hairpin-helix domain-containing protein [Acetivibrio saccincola]AUG57198.1 ComE operon protein 1 [Acetivibrio saccincola]HAA43343.1 competence protein ComEA [Ruminiclostridium sp.]HOA97900.1 helix-hairpin-helix domain-containing protein [Acetivibrio saccincola]HQD27876.1 helix-hairpin-helix domain-containing protein [Acetivibrio saccincola]